MAQNFTDDCFAPGNAGQTDLQNMENNFQALKTCFSGSSAPAGSTTGMLWAFSDTADSRMVLKMRGYNNSSWANLIYEEPGLSGGMVLNVYQQVLAGTGLSGGGNLYSTSVPGSVTLSVASSGIDSVQIKDKAVTPSKMSEIGKAPNVVGSYSTSYNYAIGSYIPFVCPTAPSTIGLSIALSQQSTVSTLRAFAYGVVITTAGDTATAPTATAGNTTHVNVFKTSTVSLSATGLTPGSSYMLAVYLRGGSTDQNAYMTGISAVWT